MSIIRIETVPQIWNDETDTAFFTIAAGLFSAEFTYGASVLLASFDRDERPSHSADFSGDTTVTADVTAASSALVPVALRRSR